MENTLNIKERIKYFQDKPKKLITFEKKSEKKPLISEQKDNGSSDKGGTFYKRTISGELQAFINENLFFHAY